MKGIKQRVGKIQIKSVLSFSLVVFIGGKSLSQQVVGDSIVAKKVVKEAREDKSLKFNLNEDGSHYFQATFLNQTWLRYNESNPGTTVLGEAKANTFDIGLRRTRIQMYGQITDRAFVYFQFGMNNTNFLSNGQGSGNRIIAAYFHDALCEYRVTRKDELKLGGGLTIANGLSRFSNPSVGTLMTLDAPVFAQATVNATDQFSRKFSVYARGQVGKIDYRLVVSDPMAAGANYSGSQAFTSLSGVGVANYAAKKHYLQQQAYIIYQFFEHENHTTPYMTGTYLGKKKVFNIGGGIIYQKDAMWKRTGIAVGDTAYQDMLLWAIESFLDVPINKEKGTAVSAYVGYFNTNYGTNYIRTQQQMNPADPNGISPVSKGGNGWPMFGTGQVLYAQAGYLFKRDLLGDQGTIMPYASMQRNMFNALADPCNVFDVGVNWLMNGHKSKISIDYQNRPIYDNLSIGGPIKPKTVGRKGCVILQYQILL